MSLPVAMAKRRKRRPAPLLIVYQATTAFYVTTG
jgi:hypothetical protein